MDPFSPVHQPDEGYSEDPLNPQDGSALLASLSSFQSPSDLAGWIARNASMFPTSVKAELTMALLQELPTSTIAGIVQRLRPRLYIDFINHLPAEICLKILSYLDPISLVNVLQTCRAWYDLALDRKLWEHLYHLEGWKALYKEIEAEEKRVNENINNSISQMQSADGPVNKVRAIMSDDDEDLEMVDSERTPIPKDSFSGQSLFGSPATSFSSSRRAITPLGDVDMSNYFTKGKGVDRSFAPTDARAKRKAPDSSPGPATPSVLSQDSNAHLRSKLWTWDCASSKHRLNWKYLYSMRRRLESNWELGKFSTFMFPHPDHPEEGHQECVYTIQFDSRYLVSGSRDRTMRIWDVQTGRLARAPLVGHLGSVLCLQFDADPEEDLLVSGSSDSNVFIWKFSTGELVQRITRAHRESVLNVRFDKRILVTSSKDKTIKIFNRRPLRYGDLGYETVGSVAIAVKPYGYQPDLAQELPVKPEFTMIGRLDGHSAAVNAIQVKGRTVVSVSGDRQIKVWDWPDQVCKQTIPAHEKGIACVEFDDRRIVSGSSDYEVCIFDAPTGLKVASLRGHANLVRTVQAGFGDLPYSKIEDEAEARLVDAEYLKAVEAGELGSEGDRRAARRSLRANAGSSKPEDIQVFGAKVPPGGGGGRKYGRIVSGSYDQSIIIWRRDKEGVWRPAHYLRQEEAAELAQSLHAKSVPAIQAAVNSSQANLPLHPPAAVVHQGVAQLAQQAPDPNPGNQRIAGLYMAYIDRVVPAGVAALEHALANYPGMLGFHTYLQSTIEREVSPHLRHQLRQAVTNALATIQNGRVPRPRREPFAASASSSAAATAGSSSGTTTGSSSRRVGAPSSAAESSVAAQSSMQPQPQPQQQAQQGGQAASASTANQVHAPVPAPAVPFQVAQAAASTHHHHHRHHHHHHPHLTPAENAPARVFKLQFDARKIICCTQSQIIVGWDFCNDDQELQEASRFFATVD
ncbi:F-box and WD domain protein [Cordyceps militaris CM01]|uniref:F-box and WD domain protein n=2 Tax=Cordyceps militaris TaxID=73501 RepID=G3JRH0_CORMM|nr:F-box and WD domain protein [Cordyceps militaris CM01]ATY65508.1 F-box and WD domain [Cordyceps militaris]EGX88573.1 F-box and WD domain protein [Cordyceps militaris CM01]